MGAKEMLKVGKIKYQLLFPIMNGYSNTGNKNPIESRNISYFLKRKVQNAISKVGSSTVTLLIVAGSFTSLALAQTRFPDTQNHWANPFIESLTQRNIISGYPDGTFRPNQAIKRDELAAIIHKAFERDKQRELASGSVYQDVPNNYWAETAIEDSTEMGFMSGNNQGQFRPKQTVSRVDVLTSLVQAVDTPKTTQATSSNSQVT